MSLTIDPSPRPDADLEPVRGAVLAQYGAPAESLRWALISGGFSGAHVWRGDDPTGGPVAVLKAWPPERMTAQRLVEIHSRMVQAGQLPFIPTVERALDGHSVVVAAGRAWDLCRWMPGSDYHTAPSPARLANACTALAQIHAAWRPAAPVLAPSSAVRRRLKQIARWRASALSVESLPTADPVLEAPFRLGWRVARAAVDAAERRLREWDEWPVFVQPCLCDVWGAHVLFSGDVVTGVIDYGSVKLDHVAVDLARLLGDLVEDDEPAFAAGLDAYRAAGGALEVPEVFVRMLDRTGVVCGVLTWLSRLGGDTYHQDPAAVAARLSRLAARVERLFPA
jgi:hypothetical protein